MEFPEKFILSPELLQKLQDFDVKRQNIELLRQNAVLAEEVWLFQTSAFLGFDLHNYNLDPATGVCTLKPEWVKQPEVPKPGLDMLPANVTKIASKKKAKVAP